MDKKTTNLDTLQNKAKERTVKTQNIEYDLETLIGKITKGSIKLEPDYQRRHRWSDTTSSKLIESLILNIPVPLVYLSYDIDVDVDEEGARYSVIDGQQRLTAIRKFFANELALTGVDILTDLEGFYYKDLPPFLIRRLEERTIKCLRIDSTIDRQVKYDIFERLNSGSVKLESQELRNATLRGSFNDLCKKLALNEDFRVLLQISLKEPEKSGKVKTMEDVELVLRFCSLINDNYQNYQKTKERGFKDFLSDSLEEKNKLSTEEQQKYGDIFLKSISTIRKNFGDQAFAKYKFINGKYTRQSNFNAAVYDALMVAVASEVVSNNNQITQHKVNEFKNLFKDEKFHNSIDASILDSTKIIYRIEKTREILRK